MKKCLMILVLFPLLEIVLFADSIRERAEAYIALYSSTAVSEMYRSGVPASITLAQGLLESGYGKSILATEANNHFGIKCHSDWAGERIYHDDDAKGECFRKYSHPSDSYKDHSDFLRFKPRYAFLFEFQTTDYKAWAYGLKKAGYATDPSYAEKLIGLVETYDLTRFDTGHTVEYLEKQAFLPEKESFKEKEDLPQTPSQLSQPVRYTGEGGEGTYAVSLSREVMSLNGVKFIVARQFETYRSIAGMYELFPHELASFNDSKDVDTPLKAGELVFLQRKAKQATEGLDKHICTEGESLRDIAQHYAVTVKSLAKRNHLDKSTVTMREDVTLLLRDVKAVKNRKTDK